MITEIHTFITSDGSKFDSREQAEQWEALEQPMAEFWNSPYAGVRLYPDVDYDEISKEFLCTWLFVNKEKLEDMLKYGRVCWTVGKCAEHYEEE